MSQPTVGVVLPPPGVIPNFVNPQSTGYKVIIVTVFTWALATFILCIRLYVKLRIIRIVKFDDCMVYILFCIRYMKLIASRVYCDWMGMQQVNHLIV
jgi:hypothetical protein